MVSLNFFGTVVKEKVFTMFLPFDFSSSDKALL